MECVDVVINLVEEDELPLIYSVEVEVFGKQAYPYWYLRFLYSISPNMFFKAVCKENVVGYIVGLARQGFCHLISIAVKREYRGKGIGSRLLKVLETACEREGYKAIVLEVAYHNYVAQKFYLAHGYKPLRVLPNYYGKNDHAILMVKIINEC